MCNFNHTTSQVRLQSDVWTNASVSFGRFNHLVNIRNTECKIQSYYVKTTGTFVENNGFGYHAKSERKGSNRLSFIADFFNGNYSRYRQLMNRYSMASVSVSEMVEYNQQLKRIHVALENKKTVRVSAKQAKHFSKLLRDRLTARGHKIAS